METLNSLDYFTEMFWLTEQAKARDYLAGRRDILLSQCCGVERQDEMGDRCPACGENTGWERLKVYDES